MKYSNTFPVVRAHRGQLFIDFMCDDGLGKIPVASIALTNHAAVGLQQLLYRGLADLQAETRAAIRSLDAKDFAEARDDEAGE